MRYLLTAALLVSGFALNAADINGIVRGKVYDKTTLEPLAGVYVLYGRNLGTTTGEDGTYIIKTTSGKLAVTFQFVGYSPVTKEVTLNDNETLELDIGLEMMVREIDQIVISAGKNEQKIAELAVSMEIIKPAFIEANHITDAQELINKTPGIEVMDGQASVRGGSGFSYGAGSRVLALIDGLPMVSADAGNIKWQFLPLENLAQVEIIKGASSVLYGSSALNGIINFRTADASNIPATGFYAETGIFGKPKNENWIWWDTPRIFSGYSFSHLRKIGKTDLGVSANLLLDEGYRRLNGEKLGRLSMKIKHFSGKIEGLTYGLNINSGYTVKRDFVLWENAATGALKQQESASIELNGSFFAVDPYITFKKSNRFRHDLRARFQSSLNRFPESEKTNSDAYSVYSEYQVWYRWTESLDVTAGIVSNYSVVNSNMYNDHKGLNLAGYSQLEIRPFYRMKAVVGFRLEQNSLDTLKDNLIPVLRAGLNWQAGEYTYLRASFGQGYRYPSIAEKHASTTLGSVIIFPNPSIHAESGWSTETGIKQGLSLGKMTGQVDFSLFMSQNINMIEFELATIEGFTGFKADNIEQSRVYGGETELLMVGSIGRVNTSLSGGYTFIYPVEFNKYTNENKDLFLKYRRMHSGKLSINSSWRKFETGINLYAKSKILRIDDFFLNETTGEAILPGFPGYWEDHNKGYLLVDGTLGYRFSDRFTLSLAVRNITNTEYLGRPGDIQPQRSYSLRFTGKM